jgi:hypothetical protein
MSYIGNTPTTQGFSPVVDYFSGNGSTTAFTLSRPVASVAQVQVTIENVPQNPGSAFTVSGNTITFDGAPPSGTNNIYVYYTSPITQVIQPGQGTVGTAQIQNGAVIPADLSTGGPFWNTSGNLGVGTTNPTSKAHIITDTKGLLVESGSGGYTSLGFKSAGGVSASLTTTSADILIGSLNTTETGSNGEFVITPSNLNRLKINSGGQITMPNQPAFFVITNGAYTVGNDIVYNDVPVNRGSHYNVSSGRFTAPVAGLYFFSMKNLQTNTSSVIRFYFVRNGTVLGRGSGIDGAYQLRIENSTGNFKEQQTSVILSLNANDYVTVRQIEGSSSVDGSGYSTFLGYLLG